MIRGDGGGAGLAPGGAPGAAISTIGGASPLPAAASGAADLGAAAGSTASAGTVSGGVIAGAPDPRAASSAAPSASACCAATPAWPISTAKLLPARKVRTDGSLLSLKRTAAERSVCVVSIIFTVGGKSASASPKSHLIGWSKCSV